MTKSQENERYIFDQETYRINKIISRLNKKGNNIKPVKLWRQFYVDSLLNDKVIKNAKDYKKAKCAKDYYQPYLDYLEEQALILITKYSHCAEDIEEINAEICLDKFNFRSNGFLQFIKAKIWDKDVSLPEDQILDILILDWYDLSEKKRKRYRKLGQAKSKFYSNLYSSIRCHNYFISNYMDIDGAWNSQEEWI